MVCWKLLFIEDADKMCEVRFVGTLEKWLLELGITKIYDVTLLKNGCKILGVDILFKFVMVDEIFWLRVDTGVIDMLIEVLSDVLAKIDGMVVPVCWHTEISEKWTARM